MKVRRAHLEYLIRIASGDGIFMVTRLVKIAVKSGVCA